MEGYTGETTTPLTLLFHGSALKHQSFVEGVGPGLVERVGVVDRWRRPAECIPMTSGVISVAHWWYSGHGTRAWRMYLCKWQLSKGVPGNPWEMANTDTHANPVVAI